jgi:hypothetical protein
MSKKTKIIIAIIVASVMAVAIPLVIVGIKKSSGKNKLVETISLQNCQLLENGTYEKNVNFGEKFTISYTIEPTDADNKEIIVDIYKSSVVS